MHQQPVVSVVMAVYNGAAYLRPAIDSVLAQTFRAFELLIIDDASTDTSVAMVRAYRDPRICLIQHTHNQGQAAALNTGLECASGRYIAIMDSDDISLPQRFAQQVALLEQHPEIDICGCWCRTIGAGPRVVWDYPTDHERMHCTLLFHPALVHSSVMLRRAALQAAGLTYDETLPRAQDYDLWVRAAERLRMGNLPRVLVLYRRKAPAQQHRQYQQQWAVNRAIWQRQLARLGLEPPSGDLELHQAVSTLHLPLQRQTVLQAEAWLYRLYAANRQQAAYPEPACWHTLGRQWFQVCRVSARLGWWVWRTFWRSPLAGAARLDTKDCVRLALKSALAFSR